MRALQGLADMLWLTVIARINHEDSRYSAIEAFPGILYCTRTSRTAAFE